MLTSERDLENYICEHQEDFIECLKEIYGKNCNIKFLGRQVDVGNSNNIADLIYFWENTQDVCENINYKEVNFIIVELKFSKLQPKHYAQLSRYMNLLQDKLYESEDFADCETYVYGTFVSFGRDSEADYISMLNLENINYIKIKPFISFEQEGKAKYNEDFVENLKIDDRIKGVLNE